MIYVRPSGPSPAKIALVGEAPGSSEEREGRPFAGAAGEELTGELHEAKIPRSECFITNVSRFRPPQNDIWHFIQDAAKKNPRPDDLIDYRGRWVASFIPEHIRHLEMEIREVNPNVIVALGNEALWALTGQRGIMNWRGSELPSLYSRPDGSPYKVVAIPHPAYILRVYADRHINVEYFRRVCRESESPEIYKAPYKFLVRPSFHDAVQFLEGLHSRLDRGPLKVTVDVETRSGFIACIGFGVSKYFAACIPFMCVERPEGYFSQAEEEVVGGLIRKILMHPNGKFVMQNGDYDRRYIHRWLLCRPKLYLDTMQVHHTLFPGLEKALDFQASIYCEHYTWWKGESKEWDKHLGEDQLWFYNCKDCCYTYECSDVLENCVPKMNQRVQVDFQMSLLEPSLDMMIRGVKRDTVHTAQISAELGKALEEREQWFEQVLGHPLNPRSAPQLSKLFYDDFKVAVILDRKTHQPTTSEEARDRIAAKHPLLKPLMDKLTQTKSIGVYKSTFVDAELDVDGRIRCTFNTSGTETFRWSSSSDAFGKGGNLQNIPGEDEDEDPTLPNVRKLFVPDPGYCLSEWDLERADLQVVVWEANDSDLKQKLREKADLHTENAKEVFAHTTISFGERQKCKKLVHLTNYGGTARTAASAIGITTHQAELMQRRWFAAHPGVKDWHRRVESSLRATKSVKNAFGFARFYFDRPEGLLPEALAWIPQSTVALVINYGLVNVYNNLPQVQLLLQVHDSLVVQHLISLCPDIFPCIRQQLLITVPYPDPLVIPVGGKWSSVSWGDCQKIE